MEIFDSGSEITRAESGGESEEFIKRLLFSSVGAGLVGKMGEEGCGVRTIRFAMGRESATGGGRLHTGKVRRRVPAGGGSKGRQGSRGEKETAIGQRR